MYDILCSLFQQPPPKVKRNATSKKMEADEILNRIAKKQNKIDEQPSSATINTQVC